MCAFFPLFPSTSANTDADTDVDALKVFVWCVFDRLYVAFALFLLSFCLYPNLTSAVHPDVRLVFLSVLSIGLIVTSLLLALYVRRSTCLQESTLIRVAGSGPVDYHPA